jgi:drug/metabolite transporter (DMT)-like permease
MHYIFIAIASRSVLKERVGFKRWVGIIFIAIGIAVISFS